MDSAPGWSARRRLRAAPCISSAGAFGFTPWLDRSAGYYATIAMERTDGRATRFSVRLQQALHARSSGPRSRHR